MAQGPGEVVEGTVQTNDSSTAATVPAPTTDAIRSQIEQTRAEMTDTIDAIQTRLSPTRAISDIKDSVTDATVGRLKRLTHRTPGSGRTLLQTARDNPLPVALVAMATVGLVVRALNNRRRPTTPRTLTDGGTLERREAANAGPRHSSRLLAAASACAACWAIWQAQTSSTRATFDPCG